LTEDDLSADQRAALAQLANSALIESAATEVVSIGRALFKDGEPSDPELQRRYRLYKRLEAALALPAGPLRLVTPGFGVAVSTYSAAGTRATRPNTMAITIRRN
jgi:hypothetical protein